MSDMYFQNLPSTSTPIIAENLNKLNDVKVSSTEPITGEKMWIQKGKNLLDKNNLQRGAIPANSSSETLDNNSRAYTTEWIPCQPNTTYIASGGNRARWQVKNASGAITLMDNNPITTTSNSKFMRCYCHYDDNDVGISNVNLQIEQNASATSYEAYIEPEIYSKNNNNVYEKLLLGKDIVESGSNYIKYADGTLICFDKKLFTKTWASDNSRITIDNPFTFPVLFNRPPIINMFSANDGDYAYCLIYGCLRNGTGITSVNLFRFNSVTNGTVVLHYIAIGKWK